MQVSKSNTSPNTQLFFKKCLNFELVVHPGGKIKKLFHKSKALPIELEKVCSFRKDYSKNPIECNYNQTQSS